MVGEHQIATNLENSWQSNLDTQEILLGYRKTKEYRRRGGFGRFLQH